MNQSSEEFPCHPTSGTNVIPDRGFPARACHNTRFEDLSRMIAVFLEGKAVIKAHAFFGETASLNHRRSVHGGHSTQPECWRRATMRPKCGCAFGRRASTAILYTMRAVGPRWRTGAGARAWLLQPTGLRAERGMDCRLGPPVRVPGLRPYDEPFAGLAASVAVVWGDSDH